MPIRSSKAWLHRLKERGVIRVALSYAVIAWLLLQIADVTFGPLGVPNWVMVVLIVTALLGLPVAVALAWFYELGDRGVERDTVAEGAARPAVHGLRRYADIAIIAVLLAAVAVLLVRQSGLDSPTAQPPAIAVLPFASLNKSDDGEVLALGIAESVLHQLAGLSEIEVIARSSSFAVQDSKEGAIEIGRRLKARYLLSGSVQSAGGRLRVTANLMDANSGAQLWSMRFDRTLQDVFAVQDEIALQVTQALELSLSSASAERLQARGTKNLEAYLAYLQGRALLAAGRVTEVKRSVSHFEDAIRIDPRFADAHTSLAEAALFIAEFEVTPDRPARFESALREAKISVARALQLDPDNGHAYLQRGYVRAFNDLAGAEQDYRRGLELLPNDARGHAGLAAVLYEQPQRRDEVLVLLDRARKLDPLEPAHDVTKAAFLYFGRSDVRGARDLLQDVLRRNPSYLPALQRLADVCQFGLGQTAEAVRYGEQALALDPLAEWTRRQLISNYLNLAEPDAAREVIEEAPNPIEARWLRWLLYQHDWGRAGEAVYRAIGDGTLLAFDDGAAVNAIRMHARATGDRSRALAALQTLSGVVWEEHGQPQLQLRLDMKHAEVAYADVLQLDGEAERAERLLVALLAEMDREARDLGRGDLWFADARPIALALLGRREQAIVELLRADLLSTRTTARQRLEAEPAYAALRGDARIQKLFAAARDHQAGQRSLLDAMRRDGLVPRRGAARKPDAPGAEAEPR